MNMRFGLGFLAAAVISSVTPGAWAATHSPSTMHAVRPKLVVLFVVDGLPQRQVMAYRDQLEPDGFARFLERGTLPF